MPAGRLLDKMSGEPGNEFFFMPGFYFRQDRRTKHNEYSEDSLDGMFRFEKRMK
jgi:hypothetical protein